MQNGKRRGLSVVVDALPVGVKIVDADGASRHFNTTWLRMTGRSLDEERRGWLDHVHSDDREACERAYRSGLASRQPFAIEYRVRCQGGSDRWLLDHAVPCYDDEGRFDGLICAALDITDRRLDESRLRDLTGRLVTAQEDERRRIARELHDNVNQRLALLAINLEQMILEPPDPDALAGALRAIWVEAGEISKEVHSLSHALHSTTLDALGLVGAVRTLSRELSAKGLRVTVDADAECGGLSQAPALCLFRIAQEALSNVLRHSGVKEATVTLRKAEHAIVLRVEDRGCGFDRVPHGDGLGILSMRERLVPLGGELRIQTRPGEGTIVEARIPATGARESAPR